ncbi:MAG: hydrogenase formation protein HypD [Candidatus Altiarchaeota archaeon]
MDEKTAVNRILGRILDEASGLDRRVRIMEVCGTHTMVITSSGLRSLLPEGVELISGPGCPACVTPQRTVNQAVALAMEGLSLATFGDMLDVPCPNGSLAGAKAGGADVNVVESPIDALGYDVFFAIGFDTTAPNTAVAVGEGLTVLNAHKRFLPAMKALLESGEVGVDGFINPGHVSTIVGSDAYGILDVPQVVAGFTPLDVLEAVLMLLRQINRGERRVENEYSRAVEPEGNLRAQKVLDSVFYTGDSEWRGLGVIPDSGFLLRKRYAQQDAEVAYGRTLEKTPNVVPNRGCVCGEVLRGVIGPRKCRLFGRDCTPSEPQGPCMVSSEGSCRIEYEYGDLF